ncbi:MAG: P-II family nitrogen regulator [Candidatus Binataceae bacterium]|jgi:nitrogen regulatory protein P-II 1|nr:P-II family nitrogen regulator [Candidatus Binataceae bacterium]
MKEIRAYVRINMLSAVIRGLEDAGFTDITVIDVRALRRGLPREEVHYSVELAERYMSVASLTIVVRDSDVKGVTDLIRARARTGRKGDGLIYVSPVEEAIHIRTGQHGESAVESPKAK